MSQKKQNDDLNNEEADDLKKRIRQKLNAPSINCSETAGSYRDPLGTEHSRLKDIQTIIDEESKNIDRVDTSYNVAMTEHRRQKLLHSIEHGTLDEFSCVLETEREEKIYGTQKHSDADNAHFSVIFGNQTSKDILLHSDATESKTEEDSDNTADNAQTSDYILPLNLRPRHTEAEDTKKHTRDDGNTDPPKQSAWRKRYKERQ